MRLTNVLSFISSRTFFFICYSSSAWCGDVGWFIVLDYGSRFHYITFDVMVNLKAGVWDYVFILIIGLWSPVQQLSIKWYQMVWLYMSIYPFTGGMWDDINVIIDLWADIILCRCLLKWKLCAYQVGVDMFMHICALSGGMWALCNIFKSSLIRYSTPEKCREMQLRFWDI